MHVGDIQEIPMLNGHTVVSIPNPDIARVSAIHTNIEERSYRPLNGGFDDKWL